MGYQRQARRKQLKGTLRRNRTLHQRGKGNIGERGATCHTNKLLIERIEEERIKEWEDLLN